MTWHTPLRFRRVCPLLVETPRGLRCSVNAPEVRPFWYRMFGYYGAAIAALYLAAAIGVFIFLRSIGYPITIVHLVWPGSWHHVTEARASYFLERSQRAFAAGRPAEGVLYLSNAYEFDPANATIGLALAQTLQLGQPARSNEIYRHLMSGHPATRAVIAQSWFRALLARGDFIGVQSLARTQVVEDPTQAGVWMRALVFATRQTRNRVPLRELQESSASPARRWRPVVETEILLQAGKKSAARASLEQTWSNIPPYGYYYQLNELIALGEGLAAIDLLGKYGGQIDDTARATLLLEAYATLDVPQSRQRLVDALLSSPLNLPTVNLLAAHLIRHPDRAILDELFTAFARAKFSVGADNLESYLALYCAAGVAGDWGKLQTIATAIRQRGSGSSITLSLAEAFFRGQTTQTRIAGLLPALPMPLEVHYALLEHYPGSRDRSK